MCPLCALDLEHRQYAANVAILVLLQETNEFALNKRQTTNVKGKGKLDFPKVQDDHWLEVSRWEPRRGKADKAQSAKNNQRE